MKKHLLVIWSIFILILLIVPISPSVSAVIEEITYSDKIVHFFMFGVFSFLLVYSYKDKYANIALYFISILLGAVYAALGEFVQSFLPGRTSSQLDFYAGALGSLIFVIIYYVRRNKA